MGARAPTSRREAAKAERPPSAVPERTHFPCFDGFRALAATSIVVLHATFISGFMFRHGYGRYLARLDIGVPVFFVISGFLLYRPFVVRHLEGRAPLDRRAYLRRRALRIVPAYWAALTCVAFVLRTKPIHSIGEFVVLYGFLQIYSGHYMHHGIQQAWTLCTELTFYLFLPVWAAIMHRLHRGGARHERRAPRVELTGVALLFAAGLAVRLALAASAGRADPLDIHYAWLPANLDLFALGMGLAVLSAADGARGRLAAVLGRAPALWWAVAAGTFWLSATRVGLRLDYHPVSTSTWMARELLYGVTSVCFLVPGIFGAQDAGLVRRVLRAPMLAALGLVSYGVYLWHEVWLDKWFTWTGRAPFSGHFWALLAVDGTLTLLVAVASWFVVERPALRRKVRPRRSEAVALA